MKENKNLDRLFQERLSNLDFDAPANAWDNIEERLKEKKKRRVVPFWWKTSGVAALLAIGFGLNTYFFQNNEKPSNEVVNKEIVKPNTNLEHTTQKNNPIKNEAVAIENNTHLNSNSSNETLISDKNSNSKNNSGINTKSANQLVVNEEKEKDSESINEFKNSNKTTQNKSVADKSNQNKSVNVYKENAIAESKNNASSIEKSKENKETDQLKTDILNTNKSNKEKELVNNNLNNSDLKLPIPKLNPIVENNINSNQKENKNTIDELKKIDSASVASVEPNALEELLKEKEKKTNAEPKLNRWQITSNVAPIYFSSTSNNGSPLDSKFSENEKEYRTSFSYGLGVNYAVNKKLKIRTGVNALSLDYNTNDIVFYQNANAKKIEHVDTNLQGSLIQIESKNSSSTDNPQINSAGNIVNKFNSSLNQKIGYIEVPFEMSYNLINKKFGVDLVGGMSTLFLNQNEVSIVSEGVQLNIGKANNLNNIHLSTNIGVGVKYGFFKRFEAKLEPVFKYQINTFTTDSGDFKPFFFGVYSGISYTF